MSDSEDYESGEGSLYSTECEEDEDNFIDEYDFDEVDAATTSRHKEPYCACSEAQLEEKRAQCVSSVTSVLGISVEDAERCLRAYKWNPTRVNEEWFSSSDMREKLGLLDEDQPTPSTSAPAQCKICFDEFPAERLRGCGCAHRYCIDCWKGYVSTAIASGPACLSLRCPDPECKVAVPASLVEELVDPRDLEKFRRFKFNSFVDDNPNMSWCTAPSCRVVTETVEEPTGPMDISCPCGNHFCFVCKEEAHRPVDCGTVKKWHIKNSNESENMNWILANTKPCPKCKRPIEKNQGCMHMTCSQCAYEFCWLCNGAWKDHGERTGGYYACNKYTAAKKAGELDDEERRREHAKNSLERYMHYFERFNCHDKARRLAIADMDRHLRDESERLSERVHTPTSQLKFVQDAWMQVIDCRRILKWSYAYGFYGMGEETEEGIRTKEFFEFLQGDAEGCLEKLHEILEKQLAAFLNIPSESSPTHGSGSSVTTPPNPTPGPQSEAPDFSAFRQALTGMTDVTRSYFTKLVDQMEKGFSKLEEDFATMAPVASDEDEPMPDIDPVPSTSVCMEPHDDDDVPTVDAAPAPRRSTRIRAQKKTRS